LDINHLEGTPISLFLVLNLKEKKAYKKKKRFF